MSAAEEDVTRREVFNLIKKYEDNGIIPPDMSVDQIIERAWYVSSKSSEGIPSSDAHDMFRKGERNAKKALYSFDAGMHLRSFEVESLKEGMEALFYVDKNERLCCEMRAEDRKIKSPLKLTCTAGNLSASSNRFSFHSPKRRDRRKTRRLESTDIRRG